MFLSAEKEGKRKRGKTEQRSRWKVVREGKKEEGNERKKGEEERGEVREVERERTKK